MFQISISIHLLVCKSVLWKIWVNWSSLVSFVIHHLSSVSIVISLKQSPLYTVKWQLERWSIVLFLWFLCLFKKKQKKPTKGWDFQPSEARNPSLFQVLNFNLCSFQPAKLLQFPVPHCWMSPCSQPPACERQQFFLPPVSLHEFLSTPQKCSCHRSFHLCQQGKQEAKKHTKVQTMWIITTLARFVQR